MVLDPIPERRRAIAAQPVADAPPSWLGAETRDPGGRHCAFCGELAPPRLVVLPQLRSRPHCRPDAAHGEALTVVLHRHRGFHPTHRADGRRPPGKAIIDEHNDIVREELHRHRGFEVKLTGDGFLIVFADEVDATRCAARLQARVTLRSANRGATWPVSVRVGIHRGDVILRPGGDILGRTVNVASRIVAKADGGMILASSAYVAEVAHEIPPRFWVDMAPGGSEA